MKKYLSHKQVEKIFINNINSMDKVRRTRLIEDYEALSYYWISVLDFLNNRDLTSDEQAEALASAYN